MTNPTTHDTTSDGATDDSADEAFPLEDLVALPEFYNPRVSPDGSAVALYWDGSGRNELYLLDPETGESTQVSDGNVPRNALWPLAWDADGERLFFHRDDAGDEQHDVYAIDRDGETEAVVTFEGQCTVEAVGPDGRYLYVTSDGGDQMNGYRHDLETGETLRLTEYDRPVASVRVAPDGDRIAYVTNESDDLENRDVYVADATELAVHPATPGDEGVPDDAGGRPRRLEVGEDGSMTSVREWGPDGDRLLVADDADDTRQVGVYHLATDEIEWLGDGTHEEEPAAFLPDGSGVVVQRTREAAVVPVVYDLTGEGRELDLPAGVTRVPAPDHESAFLDAETLVLAHATSSTRRELLAYDLSTDEYRTLKQAEYGEFDPAEFVEAEYVTYESAGGDDDHAWPTEPDDRETYGIGALLYDSGERPSPGVVKVHGGPHFQATREFDLYTQFLVSKGYTVLVPNYRGSTGRGREFKNAIHGDWGGAEQGDVAEAGRWLMDREWVDEDRVAVFGGSYGGYSVYMQLVKYPDLWATGVASVGITHLPSLYEGSMAHFKTGLRMMMGDPEANADLWEERSPLTHVENVERPLLMVHGVNDPRCPVSQARQFRDALEERGWEEGNDGDFEYVELGEEGHASTDIERRIRTFRILDDYLNRRL